MDYNSHEFRVKLKLYLKQFLLSLLAIILIIEEWLWDILSWLGHVLARLLKIQRFEEWLKNSSRYVAIIAFSIPILIVTPLNIWAVKSLANGLIMRGIIIEIFAKLFATMLFARVFNLTKTQLMSFYWFEILYDAVNRWLRWAHELIAATAIYRISKEIKLQIKTLTAAIINYFHK